MHRAWIVLFSFALLLPCPLVLAQDSGPEEPAAAGAGDIASTVGQNVRELGARLDQNDTVREISSGILEPVYRVAENMGQNQPWFYWVAFAVMVTGVVSFALQLVLTKLILLLKANFNIREILSDLLGLVISVVGLVLTTQAAAENSQFAATPSSVVSASAVGVVAGLIFWIWGTRLEFRAASARGGNSQGNAPRPRTM